MGKKGPLWWRESDWLLRGSSAANQILLRHSGPILSYVNIMCSPTTHRMDLLHIPGMRPPEHSYVSVVISQPSRSG